MLFLSMAIFSTVYGQDSIRMYDDIGNEKMIKIEKETVEAIDYMLNTSVDELLKIQPNEIGVSVYLMPIAQGNLQFFVLTDGVYIYLTIVAVIDDKNYYFYSILGDHSSIREA